MVSSANYVDRLPKNGVPAGLSPLMRVQGWGMVVESRSYYAEPRSVEEIKEIFAYARRRGLTIALRGTGCSYGDPSINEGGIVLSTTRMNRVIDWNPATGILTVEPGVKIREAWEAIIADGYWPPVVPGTAEVSFGGAASMNIHGKNSWKAGTFSDYILEFTMMLPSGEIVRASRTEEPDLFHAVIGGFGMLGVLLEMKVKMKHVPGGRLRVWATCCPNIHDMIVQFEELQDKVDYLVGWIDLFAKGDKLGRGIIHTGEMVGPEEDPEALSSLCVEKQRVSDKMFGVVPKAILGDGLSYFANNYGMAAVNFGKYWATRLTTHRHSILQSHAAFHFLLDFVPGWKNMYKPGGLIQYQVFVPFHRAEETLRKLWVTCHKRDIVPFLGVFKRHKDDPYLMTHAVDGYSVAMDIPVLPWTRAQVWDLAYELDDVMVRAGGRFYFAKDATLRPEILEKTYRPERMAAFRAWKEKCDPEHLLQSNLSRRVGMHPSNPVG